MPIGRPLANVKAYVLDAALEPVPVGIPGNLFIGGPFLAGDYLNSPEATTAKFIPNPFHPGSRLYATGDRVRYRPNGILEFLGRRDDQVKIRGYRVELGEIESILTSQPGVAEVAVVAREDLQGDRRLAAYFTWRPDFRGDPATIRAALVRALPPYMVPSTTTLLEAMPLGPNGKVDRRALPAPGGGERRPIDGPQTPEETILRRLWAQLLHRDDIDRQDSFFDLGGHSLLAVRLVAEIAKIFRFSLSIRVVFDQPSLAAMAKAIGDFAPKPGQARRIAELVLKIEAARAATTTGAS